LRESFFASELKINLKQLNLTQSDLGATEIPNQ